MSQQMYIGPSIPGTVKEGTVFYGGLPEKLAGLAGEMPYINSLVVPVDRITEAAQALKEQGSVEDVSYNRVLKYVEGVRKNGI